MKEADHLLRAQSHERFDAVLLAGDGEASRTVCGINKTFLPINGIPLFIYVLKALEQAERINRICIIGPREQIEKTLKEHDRQAGRGKNLTICEQAESLFQNVWKAFLELVPEARSVDPTSPDVIEKSILYISGDVPLVSPFEIDSFLCACDRSRYDYCLGIASAEQMSFFRPRRDMPGISTHFFHVKEGKFRQNNLHLVKPLKVKNRSYIQKIYNFRYQRDFRNILRLGREFLKAQVGWQGFLCFVLLHWHQFLSRMHLNPLSLPTRFLLSRTFIERCVSRVLGTCFATVLAPVVGAVLDIDNERDYRTMCRMFSIWQRYLLECETRIRSDEAAATPLGMQQTGTRVA